jgi:hypothetical protein
LGVCRAGCRWSADAAVPGAHMYHASIGMLPDTRRKQRELQRAVEDEEEREECSDKSIFLPERAGGAAVHIADVRAAAGATLEDPRLRRRRRVAFDQRPKPGWERTSCFKAKFAGHKFKLASAAG